jgi:hypothetical protein
MPCQLVLLPVFFRPCLTTAQLGPRGLRSAPRAGLKTRYQDGKAPAEPPAVSRTCRSPGASPSHIRTARRTPSSLLLTQRPRVPATHATRKGWSWPRTTGIDAHGTRGITLGIPGCRSCGSPGPQTASRESQVSGPHPCTSVVIPDTHGWRSAPSPMASR